MDRDWSRDPNFKRERVEKILEDIRAGGYSTKDIVYVPQNSSK